MSHNPERLQLTRSDPEAAKSDGSDHGDDPTLAEIDTVAEVPLKNAGHSSHSVKQKIFSASLWSVLSNVGVQGASFIIFMILARELSPVDFGLVALAGAFIDLTRGVMLGGIPEALIQRPTWRDAAANTAFWLNVIGSVVFIALIGLIASGAYVLGQSSLVWAVLCALSATLLIDGLRAVHEARLRREFRYKQLAARSVFAAILGGVIGVALAFAGWGVWALVASRVMTSCLQTVIVWSATSYRPRLQLERQEIGPLLRFSSAVLMGRLAGQLNSRLADIVLGLVAGPAVLGLYRVGSRSLGFIIQATITPLQTTTLSAFSRLQDPTAQARAYIRFTQVTAALTFPIFIGSAVIADDFITTFFGAKWSSSAIVMVILACSVVPITLSYFFQPAMQARGRPKAVIRPEMTKVGVGAVILSIASTFGLVAAAAGETARRYIMLPQTLWVLRKELQISPLALLKGIAPPLLCSTVMAAMTLVANRLFWPDAAPLVAIGMYVAVAAPIYVGGMIVFANRYTMDIFHSLRNGLPAPLRRVGDFALRRRSNP